MSAKGRKKAGYGGTPDKSKDHPGPTAAVPLSLVKSMFGGRALWVSLGIVIASAFIYAGVASHDFVAWDDPAYVSENLHVAGGLSGDAIGWAFTTGHMGNWHPLTWLSYMLGVQFFGLSAGEHLVTNVVLHILNSLLLFGLIHAITGAPGRSAVVAALFATHPLHVESVAWVSERKDVLSTLIGLLALWAYADYTRRPSGSRYLAVLLLSVLGLMAKPMLVTLPFMMLLLDYWPLGRTTFTSAGGDRAYKPRSAMQLVREKVPLFAIALAIGIVTLVAQKRGGAIAELNKLPLAGRIANALVAYMEYIGKMLWPAHLSALYPLYALPVGTVVFSAVSLLLISAGAFLARRRCPYLLMGWLWYLITLAPVIGLIQVGSQSMADRYTYVPLIGLFLAVVWGAADLAAAWPQWKFLLPATACVLVVACTAAAREQVQYWSNSKTLWTHAVEADANNDAAQRLLADALAKDGKRDEAITHYQAALRVRPENAEAHNGLGLALAEQGKFGEAIAQYDEALRLKPNLVDSHYNLGIALASQGRMEKAVEEYSEALRIDPEFVKARLNMGVALANLGKTNEAVAQFSEVLRVRPDNPDAHNNMGIVLSGQGRLDEAIEHFSAALRARPDNEVARANLKIAMAQKAGKK
jgi:tetratricopeptide (TPR) repeat protein